MPRELWVVEFVNDEGRWEAEHTNAWQKESQAEDAKVENEMHFARDFRVTRYVPASPLTDEEIAERAMGVLCDFIPYPEAVLPEGVDDAVKRAIRHALRLALGGE